VRADLLALADAGCRWIEVHEPAATTLGDDPAARARFAESHRALTAHLGPDVHLTLAITGGAANDAGIETILAGAYASLAIDLIDGPDNWYLAVAAPAERGIVCGALSTRPDSDDGPELMLWAARYAASSQARGIERVGLATAGSLAALPWDVAAAKVRRLGEAARLMTVSPEERRQALDPRAVDIRSAALGRVEDVGKDRNA
jgi:methionine synthase II (cobalamin-independent)